MLVVQTPLPCSHHSPRMLSDNGNLVFSTGDNKEIRFQPSATGRVRVGDEDLTLLVTQVGLRHTRHRHPQGLSGWSGSPEGSLAWFPAGRGGCASTS